MPGPTEIVATCRKAVITGVSGAPEWSELCDKLTFVRYAGVTNPETQEQIYAVYAHAHPPLRKAAWMKLFPGAETVEKVSEFEECEVYRDFKRRGALKTLGEPLRKDVTVRKTDGSKRKQMECENCLLLQDKIMRLRSRLEEEKARRLQGDVDVESDVGQERERAPATHAPPAAHVTKPERELTGYEIWMKTRKPLKPMSQLS